MKQIKNCSNCGRGIRVNVNSDILCRLKGVVTPDFACTKYAGIKDAGPGGGDKCKCIDCEFFIQDIASTEIPASSGFCQLFTVRYYNGRTKNACSKFSKKVERIVS